MRSWQLTLKVSANEADTLTDFLFELGAVSVTFTDAGDAPIFEPSAASDVIWDDSILTALFQEDIDPEAVLLQLAQTFPDCVGSCHLEELAEQAWERACLEQFQPMQFGRHLWICPSWASPPDPAAVNIILDPGLAFGTGTHPTTALCLEWLDANPPSNKTVIDYGCGSGILAIAAARLGASVVWAIDNHEQAVIATKENATRNYISATQLQVGMPEHLPPMQADIVIANILALPLIELASTLCQHVKPQGHIVLSGILAEQTALITEAYSPFIEITDISQREEWVRISGIRRIV
jgi:ribosomal protein L11 methyltransferase